MRVRLKTGLFIKNKENGDYIFNNPVKSFATGKRKNLKDF